MYRNIKKLTMLLFVAATMFTFASCNKDNTDDNPSGGGSSANYPETVNGTYWKWEGGTGDVVRVSVRFAENNSNCTFSYVDGNYYGHVYNGTFSYANGQGNLNVQSSTQEQLSVNFSVSGTTLTLILNGGTYSLTKQ